MEWNAPELKPFIDGRADIFTYNGILDDHAKVMGMDKPLETLDKYRIDYALLQPNKPLVYLLEHSPTWHSIYTDNVAVLFERTTVIAPATKD